MIEFFKKNLDLGLVFLAALVFYPLFYLLDINVYPDYKFEFIIIRAIFWGIAFICLFFVRRVKRDFFFFLLFPLAAFSVTYMTILVGEGYASEYYVGNILVVITATASFRMKTAKFITLLSILIGQHFLLLSFLPFEFIDLLKNLFFFGFAVIVSIILQIVIQNLSEEITTLKGFLPICAKCKKIRDDKGYWNQMERYISDHSQAEFTHDICPECAEELYGVEINDSNKKEQ